MGVAVDNQIGMLPVDLDRLAAVALETARRAVGVEVEISLVLTDDETLADLHERYLGIAEPTDVLSFPQLALRPGEEGVAAGALLGDVVISVAAAARQADAWDGWGLEDELALLVVHGVLHLCGYDDLDPTARALMRRREDEALATVGIGPVPRCEE